jgi:LPXTG-motif cell wall-anchored protein
LNITKIQWFHIVLAVFTVGIFVYLMSSPAWGQTAPEENDPAFWCGDNGVKFEPVDDPYIVPAPAEGTTWTLIVLKGGTTNETHINPVEGAAYSHSEHDNSHVILCWEELSDTTTTISPTTTLPTSTTTSEAVTTTTEQSTTITDPTTTSSFVPTTVDPTTTSTSVDPSTTTVPPTDPPTTTIPEVVTDLPNTGIDAMAYGLTGVVLLLMGGLSILTIRATKVR